MLYIAKRLRDLNFRQLMDIYEEGNLENAAENFPYEPENQWLLLAEQAFYQYLKECFFTSEDAVYAIWIVNNRYVSAARLESYRDGLLLEALETIPERRNHGTACALIWAVQAHLRAQGAGKIYSHVSKRNPASIAVHEKCGFRKLYDYAVYADGSVDSYSRTYIYEV